MTQFPEMKQKLSTITVKVTSIGKLKMEKTAKGQTVNRATVILADSTAAVKSIFEEAVISTAKKALAKNKTLVYVISFLPIEKSFSTSRLDIKYSIMPFLI